MTGLGRLLRGPGLMMQSSMTTEIEASAQSLCIVPTHPLLPQAWSSSTLATTCRVVGPPALEYYLHLVLIAIFSLRLGVSMKQSVRLPLCINSGRHTIRINNL